MDCCVEGYLTNFFAHCTMVMKKEMDGDSTLCFFLKTPWVPCVHTFYHRQRVEESRSKVPPMTGSSKPLRWYSFFRCLSLQTQPLSLNLELPCTFLLNAAYPASRPLGPVFWWTSWFSWATSLCTWWWWRSFATCWSRTSRILRREKKKEQLMDNVTKTKT